MLTYNDRNVNKVSVRQNLAAKHKQHHYDAEKKDETYEGGKCSENLTRESRKSKRNDTSLQDKNSGLH